jgi:hypothetical protein
MFSTERTRSSFMVVMMISWQSWESPWLFMSCRSIGCIQSCSLFLESIAVMQSMQVRVTGCDFTVSFLTLWVICVMKQSVHSVHPILLCCCFFLSAGKKFRLLLTSKHWCCYASLVSFLTFILQHLLPILDAFVCYTDMLLRWAWHIPYLEDD